MAHELVYNEQQAYVVTAANYRRQKRLNVNVITSKRRNPNVKIRKRNYTSLTQPAVAHAKSGQIARIFAGINSLSSFVFTGDRNDGYYRFISYHCGQCMTK
eukprot:29544_1